jgi:hypothetical protein
MTVRLQDDRRMQGKLGMTQKNTSTAGTVSSKKDVVPVGKRGNVAMAWS